MAVPVEDILAKVRAHHPDLDLSLIERAYEFSLEAHKGQTRFSGEAFIDHPLQVASILADMGLDPQAVAAAILHDTVEDTQATLEQIQAKFGPEVAGLVDGVTKLTRLDFRTADEQQVESLRKMFLAMARDLRVVLIKLADRLHNMRTLKPHTPEKQRQIARETLEIYTPLAHRLGLAALKWEMEDLCLRYLEPEIYKQLTQMVAKRRESREAFIADVIGVLRQRLEEIGIHADISGRPKHFYSIYRKMYVKGVEFSQIYDLIAVRVIVDTVKDCYGALGVIHSAWKPLPGRFKDYIATPKANMYQSLHTTVVGPSGEPFEIQIRTWDMHRTAEFGVAAHWRYKEGRPQPTDLDQRLSWVRGLLEWHQEFRDSREFVESLKVDLFSDQVFVFTPKGDVVDLPANATPVDFAYQIHTNLGHRTVGARVNGKIVPLDSTLKHGDVVEILSSKQSPGPSADWLKFVRTSGAKSKIRQWFRRERRDENLARGRELIERELDKHGLKWSEAMRPEWLEDIARKLNAGNGEELLVQVGFGQVTAAQVVHRVRDELTRLQRAAEARELTEVRSEPGRDFGKATQGVRVRGVENVLVRFSRCCAPVPGDPIIGFITRGRGVSIHRVACPNVQAFHGEPDRLIECTWTDGAQASYPVEVQVDAVDRPGLLAEVAAAISESRVNMLSAKARGSRRDNLATIDMVLEIRDLEQLQHITNKIRRIRDVVHVERVARETAASRSG